MPAYNADRFIEVALRSLLREREAVALDIIVIDDGSTDGTRAIVERLASSHAEVRLLENPRKGIAAARNTGLANLREGCRFVAFMDADDASVAGRLARQRTLLCEDPSIDVLYGRVEMFTEFEDAFLRPKDGSRTKVIRGPYLQSAMYRPHVFDKVGRSMRATVKAVIQTISCELWKAVQRWFLMMKSLPTTVAMMRM